jgi:hypothetical protein
MMHGVHPDLHPSHLTKMHTPVMLPSCSRHAPVIGAPNAGRRRTGGQRVSRLGLCLARARVLLGSSIAKRASWIDKLIDKLAGPPRVLEGI